MFSAYYLYIYSIINMYIYKQIDNYELWENIKNFEKKIGKKN